MSRGYISHCISEFLVSALSVGLSCLACGYTGINAMGMAYAAGIMVTTYMHIFGVFSGGHGNPCVTFLSYQMGNLPYVRTLIIMATQFIGGFAGYGAIAMMTQNSAVQIGEKCMSKLQVSRSQALILEGFLTTLWLSCWCACWDRRNLERKASFTWVMGMSMQVLTYISINYTGASFNPVRTLAAAYYTGNYENIWPFVGVHAFATWIAIVLWSYLFPLMQCCILNCPECDEECDDGVATDRIMEYLPSNPNSRNL